jgi:hypothetical protein
MSMACALETMPSAAPVAGDYLMVFSAESVPYRPTRAHTFAAVVGVGAAADGSPRVVDVCSLSWLPASGVIRPFALQSEVGRNVPLDETLQDATKSGKRICLWGPYLVRPEFAQSFRDRVARVESSFRYRGACFGWPLAVCDCTRSVEEMVGHRRFIGVFGYGAASSSVVVQLFEPWLINPCQTHPWVGGLIGLDKYPLIRRSHGDYTSRWDQVRAWMRGRRAA